MVPFLDQKTVENDADRIIPLLEGVIGFVPGGAAAVPVLQAVKMLIDNDSLRAQFVALLNKATGAQLPP